MAWLPMIMKEAVISAPCFVHSCFAAFSRPGKARPDLKSGRQVGPGVARMRQICAMARSATSINPSSIEMTMRLSKPFGSIRQAREMLRSRRSIRISHPWIDALLMSEDTSSFHVYHASDLRHRQSTMRHPCDSSGASGRHAQASGSASITGHLGRSEKWIEYSPLVKSGRDPGIKLCLGSWS
jgi:hypothetical protein